MTKFVCKSIKEISVKDIQKFSLKKETSGYLEHYLKDDAIKDEIDNTMRTYVVLDSDTEEIVGYFSLKTNIIAIDDGKRYDSLPAIEMANFAVNDNYKLAHNDASGLGKMIVSDFVLPIVRQISELVGTWGLCIYALPQDRLIDFYHSIGFSRLPVRYERRLHRRVKPTYDKDCIFMFQKI